MPVEEIVKVTGLSVEQMQSLQQDTEWAKNSVLWNMKESVIYQEIKAEGRAEGRAEGLQQGIEEGIRRVAVNLLNS